MANAPAQGSSKHQGIGTYSSKLQHLEAGDIVDMVLYMKH